MAGSFIEPMRQLLTELLDQIDAKGYLVTQVETLAGPRNYWVRATVLGGRFTAAHAPAGTGIDLSINVLIGDDFHYQHPDSLDWDFTAMPSPGPILCYELVDPSFDRYCFPRASEPAAVRERWAQFTRVVKDDTRVFNKIIERLERERARTSR
jgi:hypothetical protein